MWAALHYTTLHSPSPALACSVPCSHRKYGEAEVMYSQAMELCQCVLGPEHPRALAWVLKFAESLEKMDRLQQAGPIYQQVWDSRRSELGCLGLMLVRPSRPRHVLADAIPSLDVTISIPEPFYTLLIIFIMHVQLRISILLVVKVTLALLQGSRMVGPLPDFTPYHMSSG